jgi:hypothetical protein
MMSSKSGQATSQNESWSIEGDAEVWREFSSPSSNERFCQAWLGLLCRQLQNITTAVVLLHSEQENAFQPVAVWPSVSGDLSYLGKVAERALQEKRGVVHRDDESDVQRIQVAYPVEVSERMLGAVVLEGITRPDAQVHALLRQLHWGIAWLHNLFNRTELETSQQRCIRIGSVMELIATALRRGTLQQVLFEICNHIVQQLDCSRVAIGLAKERSIKVSALSNAAWMEKNSTTVKAYNAAMMDVVDFMEEVSYQVPKTSDKSSVAEKESSHSRLARESGAQTILSLPLLLGAECVGVITLEKDSEEVFDKDERAWLDALVGLLPAIIDQRRYAERGHLVHLMDDFRKLATRMFGSGFLIWKFSGLLVLAVTLTLALVDVDYQVSAKTVVEGELERAVVAPFDGYIKTSFVRPGDTVKKDQILCRLDDNKLKLEQQKWESEYEQYSRKLREAIASHKMSEVQVLTAQLNQAEAQYDLVTDRLEHVEIRAPFDGVVISGDLSQLIDSPVELGKDLFQIAPLDAYRVVLQVDESDMRYVEQDQHGKLMISGIVGKPVPFSVRSITPVATASDGKNYFRVEAHLDQEQVLLRPGMEGIGKITVGEFGLWWVLTHSFTDWLRLAIWKWMP